MATLEPPPLPLPANSTYWVEDSGARLGPISLNELVARLADGRTLTTGLVWKPGLTDWVAANTLPEIQSAQRVPPPLPEGPRFTEFFVGVWEVRTNPPGFEMVIRANYTANGRFEAMQMMRMLVGFDAPASTTRFGGSWKIQDVSNERFLLCLDVDPALSDSVGQAGPPTKSTVSLRFIDAATLEREEDGALVYRIG